jgi:GGDEF domain-containing protein
MAFKEPAALSKEQFRRFCEEVVLFFEHRDLIFEYRQQGISVICPNRSLEQAITSSEEFSNRVRGKFFQPAGTKIDLRFGLSSRSGRLINAERLMIEAGEALKRAIEDTASHIVAFKSDPEKYRQYLSSRPPR